MSYDTMDYRYNTFVVIWYFSKGAGGNGVYKYAKLVYLVEDESLISLALIKKYLHAPPMQGGGVTKKCLLVGRSTIVVGLFWIFALRRVVHLCPWCRRRKEIKTTSHFQVCGASSARSWG
jgi:hypothetical protein